MKSPQVTGARLPYQDPRPVVGSTTARRREITVNNDHNLLVDWYLMFDTPESVAPATSYATGIDNWRQPAYTHNNWSEIEQAQPEYPDYSSREATSLAITATQETSFTTPGPSSSKHLVCPGAQGT